MTITKSHKTYVVTSDKVKYWFNRLNGKVFRSEIPYPRNIILVERSGDNWGCCWTSEAKDEPRWWDLQLLTRYPTFKTFLEILAHEMVHAHCFNYYMDEYRRVKNGHGKRFFSWKEPLRKVGIHLAKLAYYPENSKSDPEKFSKLLPSNIKVP